MSQLTPANGQLFTLPYTQPLSVDGKVMPGCYRLFYYLNSTTLATVYSTANFSVPYTQPIVAGASGLFLPIYLNPSIEYRSQLFDPNGKLLEDCDHVNNNTAGTPFVAGYARSAVKLTTSSRTNLTTVTIDPELQIYIASAGTYKIDLDLVCAAGAAGATPGIALALSYSGPVAQGADISPTFPVSGVTNGVLATQPLPFKSSAIGLSLGTTSISNTMRYSGTVTVLSPGSSPGILALYWCQQNNSSSATSILAGSSMTALQVQ